MRFALATCGVTVAIASASAITGCSSILGIQDFTVLDAGADGSSEPTPDGSADLDATTASDVMQGGDRTDGEDASDAGQNVGDSSKCVPGATCIPGECKVGQTTCDEAGVASCGSVQAASNGISCGGDAGDGGATGSVCSQGVCTACNSGGDCSVANSCKKSVYVCTTGAAVCTETGSANDGTPCGSAMVCSGGVCSACAVGNPCTPANACHAGTISSCAGGVATCTDMMTAANNGMSCGTNMVCNAGSCAACAANVACTPTNPCHSGTTSCATGVSTCTDTGNQTNGTMCTGTDKCFQSYSCQSGMCTGASPITCAASDQCHTAGTCDPTTGTCSNPTAANSTSCTGTDKCNQTYTCQGGTCTGSNPVSCSGGKTCQGGTCVCPSGMSDCGGTCADLTSSSSNCNRCGHSCQGGACTGSLCQVVTFTTLGSTVADIASDGTVVVWTDSGDNSVDQVSSPGGSKIVLASSGQGVGGPTNIAIDPPSGGVFWLNGSGSSIGCTTRVPNGGTPGTPSFNALGLGAIIPSAAHALVPAGSAGGWFLINTADVYSTSCGATVAPSGGTMSGLSGKTLASTPNGFVFGDIGNAQVDIIGAGGSLASITGQSGVDYVASDGTYAYWATTAPSISRALLTNTTVLPVIASNFNSIQGLATDGTNVYFAAVNGIFYAPVAGGAASSLTATTGNFLKYASGAVYFASGGTIYKMATP